MLAQVTVIPFQGLCIEEFVVHVRRRDGFSAND
jgi:hypothetical protein